MEKETKVLLLTNIMAPTRLAFFEALNESGSFTLKIFYCASNRKDRIWDTTPRAYKHDYKILPGFFIGTYVNPTIISEISRFDPDVVIISGWTDITMQLGFLYCKIKRIPTLFWVESMNDPRSIFGKITWPLRKTLFQKTKGTIVPGSISKSYALKAGVKKSAVFIAPNSVDTDLYLNFWSKNKSNRKQLRTKYGVDKTFTVICVCRFIEQKGIKYLLNAYQKFEKNHPKSKLLLIGRGPLESELKSLVKKLDIQNVCIKPISNVNLLSEFYSISDVFVLPTLSDVWGFVINEAMIFRLPVISTFVCQAAKDMIKNGENGFIIEPSNSNKIFERLEFLAKNSEIKNKIGKNAQNTVLLNFNIRQMVNGFLKAIEYALEK